MRNKKKKMSVPQTDSSDSEHSLELKSVFSDIHSVFRNTWLQKGVIVSLDYLKMAEISSDEEATNNSTVV